MGGVVELVVNGSAYSPSRGIISQLAITLYSLKLKVVFSYGSDQVISSWEPRKMNRIAQKSKRVCMKNKCQLQRTQAGSHEVTDK